MATPSPIKEIRNSAMKLTSVSPVSPRTPRNVVMIETTAISSGSTARKLANMMASTSRAPIPPIRVSATTPTPPELVPAAASWANPVASACAPAGAECCTVAARPGAEPGRRGSGGVKISP